MNVRRWYIPIAIVWTVLVPVLATAAPVPLLDRLPDPLATHWGPAGRPDDASPYWLDALILVLMWAAIAAVPLYRLIRGDALRRRHDRGWMCAVLAGGGVFTLALQAMTILANLDRAHWRDAAPIGIGTLLAVFGAAALAGAAAWALARIGPDEEEPATERPPRPLRPLRSGERAVWVSSATAGWAVATGAGLLVLAVLLGVVIPAAPEYRITLAASTGVSALVLLALSGVRVQVTARGLAVAFGPLRWPRRRIPLDRIDRAFVQQRWPFDVGGWGYRVRPGGSTVMIRGGECLVVRYGSGRELAVSVDDAERGAALLNSLVAERDNDRS
ncbi:MAG: DUF1648 domain-containing protein [Actinomycetes bacterium]|jgi:hypothetical protein|nr:MAG: hypothetical protein DIU60_18520 [Actinomycetota bacterium]